ncbi:MAG: hypothetical protein K2L63_06475, partial [Paramuribaculum sp.]|nr:hypothetical protein [Paramuribaculum sp.]
YLIKAQSHNIHIAPQVYDDLRGDTFLAAQHGMSGDVKKDAALALTVRHYRFFTVECCVR